MEVALLTRPLLGPSGSGSPEPASGASLGSAAPDVHCSDSQSEESPPRDQETKRVSINHHDCGGQVHSIFLHDMRAQYLSRERGAGSAGPKHNTTIVTAFGGAVNSSKKSYY